MLSFIAPLSGRPRRHTADAKGDTSRQVTGRRFCKPNRRYDRKPFAGIRQASGQSRIGRTACTSARFTASKR